MDYGLWDKGCREKQGDMEMNFPQHKDKNGKEIYGHHKLRDSNGNYYEPCGTGIQLPGSGGAITLWNANNKLCFRQSSELEIAPSYGDEIVYAFFVALIIFGVAFLILKNMF